MTAATYVTATFVGTGRRSDPLKESEQASVGALIDSTKPSDWWGDVEYPRTGRIKNNYTVVFDRASDGLGLMNALRVWATGKTGFEMTLRSFRDDGNPKASAEIKLMTVPHLIEVTPELEETLAIADEVLAEMEKPRRKKKTSRKPRRK